MKMNFESIKNKYVALYHECYDFIIDPNSVWEKVVNEQRTWTDTQTRLLYPLLALICLLGLVRVLVQNFYISGYNLLEETLIALSWPVILAISLLIAAFVCRLYIKFLTKKQVDFERMVIFMTYAEIPVFLSFAIMAVLPFMFPVLIFVNFYSAYIIMSGYNVYFADIMGEDRKYHFPSTLITFIIIYALTYMAWGALAKI